MVFDENHVMVRNVSFQLTDWTRFLKDVRRRDHDHSVSISFDLKTYEQHGESRSCDKAICLFYSQRIYPIIDFTPLTKTDYFYSIRTIVYHKSLYMYVLKWCRVYSIKLQ